MKLTLEYRRKQHSVTLEDKATVNDLKKLVQKTVRLNIHRQGLKNGDTPLRDGEKPVTEYGVADGSTIGVKDYGPQVGYRTVFIVEYAGPLFFMLAFFYGDLPALMSGQPAKPHSTVATWAMWMWVAHFAKREFETLFVHKFSRPTMPLFNIFKNSIYYWSFGALCGYFLCHPLYTAPTDMNQVFVGMGIMGLAEVGNFAVHLYLATLRPKDGSTQRPIPKGPLFSLVSCPNYTFEVLCWVGFSIMTNLAFSWLFTLVGGLQMYQWAVGKHRNYIKTYGDAYKKLGRKAMFPFLA
eukprot:NODE_1074_length_1023_cov_111.750000_g1029_i0.p1 GENE.NODE_1074_length_1023_cov_111.750000_g1029_i0~~NODE_1074_length_1023_cov_111.750000_g1029_i0.p1  ORF type:complete len:295 (-),score=47.85 NODE_1074_length_1023_cov_111.750000_g1029_i0:61-945(-)